MAHLTIADISKTYDHQTVLKNINMEISAGNIVSLLGPSGCGKTTLLRIVAGLTAADSGKIILNDQPIDCIPPHERRFGLMFQEFALFPHKNVLDNVAYGLQMQRSPKKEIRNRAAEMLELVGLTGFETRDVADLSGGERQRVALARSLAPQPHLLMLDEPLGALDRILRQRLMIDLIRILRQVHVTTIFVTHDQTEALAMADQIAVMDSGRIEQIASPERLYNQPANGRVARFLGFENLFNATVIAPGKVETPLGRLLAETGDHIPGSPVTVLLRPDRVWLDEGRTGAGADSVLIQGKVVDAFFWGHSYRLHMQTDRGVALAFDLPNDRPPPSPGTRLKLMFGPAAVTIIQPG